ncbi:MULTISPECIES: bifunctional helix-turn-helix transcriptional regulator/GNAT family N-acetyltransferase [Nonomuraea]|jgi:DNA-binding MarR family transcriptional regulator/GNAT superfamily N-acetyltransferase|uniref:GNAT family N-acetyltransferase n=2 Tax=Nonomuraea TaxID=83681 RepID=A0ABW1BSU3_9ACTN|nr:MULTISPECIES: helix-turn-helix domain-containing GNAT family N-acetyltransferase [Nonomuraea]MDA0639984.1 helix-turn-helix domain-containing GNAT family N-acetyltransferase [Nonomuraea ferruginea]
MNSLTEARVSEVRAFNRFYTKVIGVLQAGMHHLPYSLTEGRVLFEVAHADSIGTGELRALLDLDAGYLSRILARFDGDGLIVRERSAADARKHVVRLSPAGRKAFETLDQASNEDIERLLAGLPEDARERLVTGMRAIRDVLDPPAGPESCLIRPLRDGDLSWVVHRHGVLYAREYGWGRDFELLVARIVAAFDPSRDTAWIAEVGGRPAGSVFYMRKDDTTGQLRLLLVEPSARGLGLGRRLVDECVRHARADGCERLVLWTRDCLTSARRVYEAAGFRLDSQEKGMENGIELNEEMWSLDLAATS